MNVNRSHMPQYPCDCTAAPADLQCGLFFKVIIEGTAFGMI